MAIITMVNNKMNINLAMIIIIKCSRNKITFRINSNMLKELNKANINLMVIIIIVISRKITMMDTK